ncbi:tripartite tricarboxylate transporter TctB family protein [Bosea minatitlanensis]|uniref:Tripartite tricarboxylate transporter TctB family protein n=1 Tax=Bosea minatitlanensis TaxID=128782 RepID=A0ABW0F699_9HYPH|nr:tripartite tricarboxylate transporter TctB family protein [Bosea minatitlanensis]MCT4493304.1 tripartite tricarboxylate transporter TctB family protein [Bosea minatitlanensis]
MITRFWAEIGTAILTLAFGLVIVKGSLEFGIGWDSSGPQPGAFPFYAGGLVALASLGTLALTFGKRLAGKAMLADAFLDAARGRRVLSFLLPLVAFVVLSVTLGMYVATILYLVFAMRFQGGYGWIASLATAILTAAFFYFALEKFFQIGLLKGPLEPLLGL